MKTHKVYVGLVLAFVLLTSGSCERAQVVIDNFGRELDEQIGALDVQRQRVVNAIDTAKQEKERFVHEWANASVELDYAAEKLDELQQLQLQDRERLSQLADLIENGEKLVLSDGRELAGADLEKYANDKITIVENRQIQIELAQETVALWQEAVNLYDERLGEADSIIIEMEGKLPIIDAQMATLRAYKDRPNIGQISSDTLEEARKIVDDTMKLLEKERAIRGKLTLQPPSISVQDIDEALDSQGQEQQGNPLVNKLREMGSVTPTP